MPVPKTLDQHFFKTWTPEMAYVLGYFAADGSMLKNSRGAHFIEFTSIDRILIEQVQNATQSNHRIAVRTRRENDQIAYRLQLGSKEWYSDLTRLGFVQSKSKTLCFPSVPPEFAGDFVRGYFDGDGCVYFKQHWSLWHKKRVWVFTTRFTSGCEPFLVALRALLGGYGISGGYLNRKKRGGLDLVFSRNDSLALYRLMYHTASASDLYLPRKRHKLETAIRELDL